MQRAVQSFCTNRLKRILVNRNGHRRWQYCTCARRSCYYYPTWCAMPSRYSHSSSALSHNVATTRARTCGYQSGPRMHTWSIDHDGDEEGGIGEGLVLSVALLLVGGDSCLRCCCGSLWNWSWLLRFRLLRSVFDPQFGQICFHTLCGICRCWVRRR